MNANESARPEPVAYCLTRPAWWRYVPAVDHAVDPAAFKERQLARLVAAQPWLAQQSDRAAA